MKLYFSKFVFTFRLYIYIVKLYNYYLKLKKKKVLEKNSGLSKLKHIWIMKEVQILVNYLHDVTILYI